ncbi:MAG: radical SAM protein [Phycisphaerae bacterium]|nr:radical SAM protein [Phycisphaerae bacterium]
MPALPYNVFELTLMVTAECPLRCTYCYNGPRRAATMDVAAGRRGIDRAVASMQPGGRLELGFFGGEPLLEAPLIRELLDYARAGVSAGGGKVDVSITTNGVVDTPAAWDIMLDAGVRMAVSCDGAAATHDRHRKLASGAGSHTLATATLARLLREGRPPTAVMVTRPDTVADLPAGLEAIRDLGVGFAHPSLDLWCRWNDDDMDNLSAAVEASANIWRPANGFGIGWFDDMASRLAGLNIAPCARCAFGAGQIAVSPAGNLYPCERLIGQDGDDNPHRLHGHVMDGGDFLGFAPTPARAEPQCAECTIRHACNTFCRCSNVVRTGDGAKPDRLLCELNRMIFRQVCRVLKLE